MSNSLAATLLEASRFPVALLRCWPILTVPALLVLLAVGTDQGRDAIAAAAANEAFLGQGFLAYVAQTLTTILATATALVVLEPDRATTDADRLARHHVPGLVGLVVGFAPSLVLQESGFGGQSASLFLAVSALVPMIWVIVVRDILPSGGEFSPAEQAARSGLGLVCALAFIIADRVLWVFLANVSALALLDGLAWRQPRRPTRRVDYWTALLAALAAACLGLLFASRPAPWGMASGTYTTMLVALGFWLGLGCLSYMLLRPFGSRVVANLAVVLLAFNFVTGPFDLREVRLLPMPAAGPSPPTLEDHARDWLQDRRTAIDAAERYPVFIVNADGGGIRAAWWSAAILGALQDRAAGFADQVFAVSGVSGGSLGAAVFAARAAEPPAPGSPCATLGWQACAALALGQDMLAPALASMLVADVGRSILRADLLPDRATALEQAFAESWRAATFSTRFEQPFTALWAGDNRLRVPLLLLNSTDARSGRRLVFAPTRLSPAGDGSGATLALLGGRQVRLSTAVLLSARFPLVSPAGWLPSEQRPGAGTAIVDGGYADNSGTASAAQALAALRAAAASLGIGNLQPVALMIANDPVPPEPPAEQPGPAPRGAFATTTFGSLVAPVMTLDQLRQVGTRRAKRAYAVTVRDAGGVVLDGFDLRMGAVSFPLGWMLAEPTRRAMAEQIGRMAATEDSDFSRAAALVRAR